MLDEVYFSNGDHIVSSRMGIPNTVKVSLDDSEQGLIDKHVQTYRMAPAVTISKMTTADAIRFFGQDPKRIICALNFASGERAGGNTRIDRKDKAELMPDGSDNQEEDLCRR